MKRIFIPVFAISIVLISSCNNEKSVEEQYHEWSEQGLYDETGEQDESTKSNESSKLVDASNSYDIMLDDYEEFIDTYIVIMKKIQKNDMSVMDEYTELIEKADNFDNQLDKNESDMTKEQMKRYLDLQNKFTKAAMDM